MTGAERTLAALEFRDADRPPVAGGLLQNADFLARKADAADFWAAPEATLYEGFRRLGADAILGPVMPKRPETTTRDWQGRETSFALRHDAPQISDPEGVARHAASVPDPASVRASFDFQAAYDAYLQLFTEGDRHRGEMLLIPHCLGYAPNYPTSDGYYSYEAFLIACAAYTEDMARLFSNWAEHARCRYEAVAQATREHNLLPVLWTGQDLCDAKGSVLSPRLLDRLYLSPLERAFEPLKAAGIRIVWHSDANYRQIAPRLLEIGIDGFQGLYETAGGTRLEDLARLRTREGRPPIIFGSISTVWVLPHGSPDDVRREVERCVEAVGPQGGLVLAPSSSIGPEVSDENIEALYDHARNYVPSWKR